MRGLLMSVWREQVSCCQQAGIRSYTTTRYAPTRVGALKLLIYRGKKDNCIIRTKLSYTIKNKFEDCSENIFLFIHNNQIIADNAEKTYSDLTKMLEICSLTHLLIFVKCNLRQNCLIAEELMDSVMSNCNTLFQFHPII